MQELLTILRALSDPTRLRIVRLLRKMELSVGELAQVLGQSQPRVSRHVRILCDAGLARRRREGSWVFLAPATDKTLSRLNDAMDAITLETGEDHWSIADAARLAAVHADRAAAAQSYFAIHAESWDAIRSLHVAESEVEAAILDMLGGRSCGQLLDIGTGTGRIIELLADKADRAIGVDRSPEMLRLARARLSQAGRSNWELQQADVGSLPFQPTSFDTLVIHQVLHFLPAPEVAIASAAGLLRTDGQLLIVDFAPHDHEELRDAHAHTRLGFSDEQIIQWLHQAGMEIAETRALSGGDLSVKLWRARPVPQKLLKVA